MRWRTSRLRGSLKGAGVGAATSVVVHARGWHFTQTPPGWRPDLRERFVDEFMLPKDTQRIDAPTPYVWIIGRTKTDGPADYEAVHKIQAGLKVTLLSEWGTSCRERAAAEGCPAKGTGSPRGLLLQGCLPELRGRRPVGLPRFSCAITLARPQREPKGDRLLLKIEADNVGM